MLRIKKKKKKEREFRPTSYPMVPRFLGSDSCKCSSTSPRQFFWLMSTEVDDLIYQALGYEKGASCDGPITCTGSASFSYILGQTHSFPIHHFLHGPVVHGPCMSRCWLHSSPTASLNV